MRICEEEEGGDEVLASDSLEEEGNKDHWVWNGDVPVCSTKKLSHEQPCDMSLIMADQFVRGVTGCCGGLAGAGAEVFGSR